MRELMAAALGADANARQLLYFRAYLWPLVLKEFANELKPFEHVAGPHASEFDLAGILATVALGPQPEPPDLPASNTDAIAATKRFHDGLMHITSRLGKVR